MEERMYRGRKGKEKEQREGRGGGRIVSLEGLLKNW